MKIKNKGKYNPVEIEVQNSRTYAIIAFLVDNLDFIDEIKRLRNRYSIEPLLFKDEKEEILQQLLTVNIDPSKNTELVKPEEISNIQVLKNKTEHINKVRDNNQFSKDIISLRRKFNYPPIYDEAIKQVVFYNKVFMNLSSVKEELVFNGETIMGGTDEPLVGLFISPHSTLKDIVKAFQEAQKRSVKLYSGLGLSGNTKLDKDTVTNIKRDRDWHWKQHENTYSTLVDEWNNKPDMHDRDEAHPESKKKRCDNCLIYDQNYIEQAVARYRRNLQKTDI